MMNKMELNAPVITEKLTSENIGELVFTSNRRLENFLYMMGIRNEGYVRNWDGYTVWRYRVTQAMLDALASYAAFRNACVKLPVSEASA